MLDEEKLNKFLSLDWGQIEKDLEKINMEIELLEKIALAVDAINEVVGLFYEEKYGGKIETTLEDIEEY